MDSKGSILCKRETERDFIDTGKLQDTDLEKCSDMTTSQRMLAMIRSWKEERNTFTPEHGPTHTLIFAQ